MCLVTGEKLEEQGLTETEILQPLEGVARIGGSEGAMVAELEQNMLTRKEAPRIMIPGTLMAERSGFEGTKPPPSAGSATGITLSIPAR